MNIALEKTGEYVDGELKRSYGDAFVRGNNGLLDPLTTPLMSSTNDETVLYISAD